MSDSPIVFKRTKSKPATRTRAAGESQPEVADSEDAPSTIATKLKKQIKTRAKPKTQLSFGGEEEVRIRLSCKNSYLRGGRRVRVKYSRSKSQILAGNLHWDEHQRRSRKCYNSRILAFLIIFARNVVNNGGPTYDANYLSELKASTPSSRPQPQPDYDADTSIGSEITMEDIPMEVDGK